MDSYESYVQEQKAKRNLYYLESHELTLKELKSVIQSHERIVERFREMNEIYGEKARIAQAELDKRKFKLVTK